MYLNKFVEIFKRFAGNGRAWKLKDFFTNQTITAFLSISTAARSMLKTIPLQAYPWLCDDSVIPYWEEYFGIKASGVETIAERRRAVVAEYVAIGCNSAQYLEYILSRNGFDSSVLENKNGYDLSGTWDIVRWKVATGEFYSYGTPPVQSSMIYEDTIAKPATTKEFKKVFAVLDTINDDSIDLLKRILIKYKPQHTVAIIVNNDINSTFWDSEIMSEFIEPLHVMDSELLSLPDNSVFVFDAELI